MTRRYVGPLVPGYPRSPNDQPAAPPAAPPADRDVIRCCPYCGGAHPVSAEAAGVRLVACPLAGAGFRIFQSGALTAAQQAAMMPPMAAYRTPAPEPPPRCGADGCVFPAKLCPYHAAQAPEARAFGADWADKLLPPGAARTWRLDVAADRDLERGALVALRVTRVTGETAERMIAAEQLAAEGTTEAGVHAIVRHAVRALVDTIEARRNESRWRPYRIGRRSPCRLTLVRR